MFSLYGRKKLRSARYASTADPDIAIFRDLDLVELSCLCIHIGFLDFSRYSARPHTGKSHTKAEENLPNHRSCKGKVLGTF